jgi:cyanophycin synthetase
MATADNNYYRITNTEGKSVIGRGGRLNSSANGVFIARDKLRSYGYLRKSGYAVPDFMTYDNQASAAEFLARHNSIVVKPVDAEQSRGVTVDVTTEAELEVAVEFARRESETGRVLLQQQLSGQLYRLLVVGDHLFAAAYRRAAFVTGDGIHTVEELINEKNKHPLRGNDSSKPLKYISLTSAQKFVGEAAMSEILPIGEEKELLAIASVSLGGEAEDVTTQVSSSLARVVVAITADLGLSVCGFDIMCDDIATLEAGDIFPIIELNSLPGFKLHIYPTAGGESRNPAMAILDRAFS